MERRTQKLIVLNKQLHACIATRHNFKQTTSTHCLLMYPKKGCVLRSILLLFIYMYVYTLLQTKITLNFWYFLYDLVCFFWLFLLLCSSCISHKTLVIFFRSIRSKKSHIPINCASVWFSLRMLLVTWLHTQNRICYQLNTSLILIWIQI